MNKTYRIKDIAEMSGVSVGTIDRILHNRGKVSEEARLKVEKVLKEINYQPNLIARSLALKKKYRIICVMPSYSEGEYWEKFSIGVNKTAQELYSYNVTVDFLYFDQYDKTSFERLIPIIEKEDFHGIVLSTQFQDLVKRLASQLDIRAIPYMLIDSYVEGTNCMAYYGTNSLDSGYLAGRLLFSDINKDEDIATFHFFREGEYETRTSSREIGFKKYLEDSGHEGKVYSISIHSEMTDDDKNILRKFVKSNSHVKAGVVFNSKAHVLGRFFKENDVDFKVIGYDAIDANIDCMKDGSVSYLIAQRPEVQGVNCVRAMFRHLLLDEKIKRINYMPLDIIMKENLEYYDNYI
jgi:LacI family transcriptional regulator